MKPMALNMSKMQKVDGDKHSSTFLHDDGHMITIAHSKLPALQRKQLEKMPIKMMSEGGAVSPLVQELTTTGQAASYRSEPPPSTQKPVPDTTEKKQDVSSSYKSATSSYAEGGTVGIHHSDMEVTHPKDKKEKSWAGESTAGRHLREEDIHPTAHKKVLGQHYKVLSELKQQPKAKLQGLAKGGEVKGVHTQHEPQYDDKESQGESKAGNYARLRNESGSAKTREEHATTAHYEHLRVLSENRKIKPKLQGLAEGGEPDDGLSVADPNQGTQVPIDPVSLPQPSSALLPNGSMNAPGTAQLNQQAGQAQYNVDVAKGKAQANLEQGYIQQAQENQKRQQDLFNNVKGHVDDLRNYIQQHPIDPNHYWESKSTGSKVSTALGLIIGGFAGGANGGAGANPALNFMNSQIDRDVAAQQMRLDQQKTLLGAYQDLYGKGDAAIAATKASLQDIYNHQAKQIADRLGTPQAQANFLKYMATTTPMQNKNILDASGSLGRATLPMNNASGATATNPHLPPQPQDSSEDSDSILAPDAESRFTNQVKYDPRFKDKMGDITNQYNQAVQADKSLKSLPQTFDTLAQDAQKTKRLGRLRRETDDLSNLPFGIGNVVTAPVHMITDTPSNREYDSARSDLLGSVSSALKGTNIGSGQIEDIVKSNSPEYGDSPADIANKKKVIMNFIKKHTDTSLLKAAKLTK
jgi:hypothetical protein